MADLRLRSVRGCGQRNLQLAYPTGPASEAHRLRWELEGHAAAYRASDDDCVVRLRHRRRGLGRLRIGKPVIRRRAPYSAVAGGGTA